MPNLFRFFTGSSETRESRRAAAAFRPLRDIMPAVGAEAISSRPTNAGDVAVFRHPSFAEAATWAIPGVIEFAHFAGVPSAELVRLILSPGWYGSWMGRIKYTVKSNGQGGMSTYGSLQLQLGAGPQVLGRAGPITNASRQSYADDLVAWLNQVTASNPGAYAMRHRRDNHRSIMVVTRTYSAGEDARRSSHSSRRSSSTASLGSVYQT